MIVRSSRVDCVFMQYAHCACAYVLHPKSSLGVKESAIGDDPCGIMGQVRSFSCACYVVPLHIGCVRAYSVRVHLDLTMITT